jgi:hypothetical protein
MRTTGWPSSILMCTFTEFEPLRTIS